MLKKIGNVELSPLILGDSAYSLENWLMEPYSDRDNLSPEETRFNFAPSRSRVVVENAFGLLKGRFQCIAKILDTTLEHTLNFVTTCCILHTFCIITKLNNLIQFNNIYSDFKTQEINLQLPKV